MRNSHYFDWATATLYHAKGALIPIHSSILSQDIDATISRLEKVYRRNGDISKHDDIWTVPYTDRHLNGAWLHPA